MEKTKKIKIADILVNTAVGIIILIALIAMLFRTSVFGIKFFAVKSGSMDGGYSKTEEFPPSFKKGDLVFIKTLSNTEKKQLKVGQIITYNTLDIQEGKKVTNTHRIMKVLTSPEGDVINYKTAGDHNLIVAYGGERKDNIEDYFSSDIGWDDGVVSSLDIVGVYTSKAVGLGTPVNFMQSPTGFFVFVVIPCLLIMLYSGYLFFKALDNYKKEKYALIESEKEALASAKQKEELEKLLEIERERIKEELLKDLNKKE